MNTLFRESYGLYKLEAASTFKCVLLGISQEERPVTFHVNTNTLDWISCHLLSDGNITAPRLDS